MSLVGIKRCEEAVLKRCVLRRLAQVAVHFASTAEKTRSTPAEDAGATKYCFTILARLGQRFSLAFHQSSTFTSSSGSSASARYLSSSSRAGAAGESPSLHHCLFLDPPAQQPAQRHLPLLLRRLDCRHDWRGRVRRGRWHARGTNTWSSHWTRLPHSRPLAPW